MAGPLCLASEGMPSHSLRQGLTRAHSGHRVNCPPPLVRAVEGIGVPVAAGDRRAKASGTRIPS
jgi:hypothetical protein